MATRKIRYFVEKPNRDGTVRRYWQPSKALRAAGWEPELLPDELGAAIARAEQRNAEVDAWRLGGPLLTSDGRPQAERTGAPLQVKGDRTLSHVIALYKASERYTAKRDSTRAGYDWLLLQLEAWAGDIAVAAIDRPRVQTYYEGLRKAGKPAKANALLRMLRIVLGFAFDKGWVRTNAAEKPGLVGTPPRLRIWSAEELIAQLAAADYLGVPSIGDAVVLALYLGQRQGDVLAMTRLQYQALQQPGAMTRWGPLTHRVKLQQRKTGARIDVPVHPLCSQRLALALARLEAAGSAAPTLVVCEATGAPYKSDHFRHEFARVRAVAAAGYTLPDGVTVAGVPSIADAWFLDLRDTAVTRLAEAGCTIPEICAITGHAETSAHQILKHYLALTSAMADSAIAKLLAHDANRAELPATTRHGDAS